MDNLCLKYIRKMENWGIFFFEFYVVKIFVFLLDRVGVDVMLVWMV